MAGPPRTADVVVVGGGVIGSAIASFLAVDPGFDGTIAVVERDPTFRHASSALSASSIRQQFSTPENIRMSRYGFSFLGEIGARLEHPSGDGQAPDVSLVERGYLYLAGPAGEATMREVHAVQRAEGADVVLLTPDDLRARYPWLSVEGIALGSLGRSGEGWFDGEALLRAFRRHATANGAIDVAASAVAMPVADGRVAGVTLADGSAIACGIVVDAAGPWAGAVAAMAGVALPVEARRRCVFVFEPAEAPVAPPLVIDPSGAWFRPEGGAYIGAIAPREEEDAPDLPLVVDEGLWAERLWPAMATRVPAFDRVRRTGGWAGYYEWNTWDHNALLGPHPDRPNLLIAAGFSGHGIQQAPAVGRAIAERIVHGRWVSLDLSVFAVDRIAAGRRVLERNVIG
jgi:glycine/D-amino acid oxidase-like deaminating enzyme